MVHDELRAAVEQLGKRPAPVRRVEDVLLLDLDPGQRLAFAGDIVAQAGQLLLALQQRQARLAPLLAGSGAVHEHQLLFSKCASSFSSTLVQPALTPGLSKWGGASVIRS